MDTRRAIWIQSDGIQGWSRVSLNGLPAVFLQTFGFIGAVEEFALEELHSDNSEDEHEEDVDDEDVQNVLQRVYNTVEHRLVVSHTNTQTDQLM